MEHRTENVKICQQHAVIIIAALKLPPGCMEKHIKHLHVCVCVFACMKAHMYASAHALSSVVQISNTCLLASQKTFGRKSDLVATQLALHLA